MFLRKKPTYPREADLARDFFFLSGREVPGGSGGDGREGKRQRLD